MVDLPGAGKELELDPREELMKMPFTLMARYFLLSGLLLGWFSVVQAEIASIPISEDETRREEAKRYLRANQFGEAEKILFEILSKQTREWGGEDPRLVDALYELGWFYSNLPNYSKAEPLFLRAQQLQEKSTGRQHRRMGEILNSRGVLYENMGRYPESEKYFLEALEIQKEVLGPDTATVATTLNNLATLYWSQSDYQKAEFFFNQALTIRTAILGRGSLLTTTTVNNLALVYLGMGDYARAEPLFWRVLRVREQKLGVNHPLTLTSANHLGLLYYDLGDYSASESFLLRAAQNRQKAIGTDNPDTARSWFHLACLYDKTGQYEKAGPLHQQAYEIRCKVLGPDHPETSASEGFWARHEHLVGNQEAAARLYQSALEKQRKFLGVNHPDNLKTLENFAALELERHRPDQARKLIEEAAGIREYLLQNLFTFTSEKRRIEFQKTLRFYSLAASLGDPECLARIVYRTKGVVLDSLIEDHLIAGPLRNEQTDLLRMKIQSIDRRLEAPEQKSVSSSDREESHADLERERDRLRAELSEVLGLSRQIRSAFQIEPENVAQAVPVHAALVEFIRYESHQGGLKFIPSYGVLIQLHGKKPVWVPLGPAQPIDRQIALYQKYVRNRVREAVFAEVLQQLYQLLWQPLVGTIPADCKRVIISPDDRLNFLSFATLLAKEDRFLAEKWGVEYVSSARSLLRAAASDVEKSPKMVIFASPDFEGSGRSGRASRSDQIPLLPGAKREAELLSQQAKNAGVEVDLYWGSQATEAGLRSLTSPWILHLATHGFYRVKSGVLALSGAQQTFEAWQKGERPPPENDGLLNGDEAGALNLRDTWLVTLSACDTGMGEAQAGEGVLGLRRGFLFSGARNLLMTLWSVSDAESASLMSEFYREAFRRRDAAGALTEVQTQALIRLRREKGLWPAVQAAGPYILSH